MSSFCARADFTQKLFFYDKHRPRSEPFKPSGFPTRLPTEVDTPAPTIASIIPEDKVRTQAKSFLSDQTQCEVTTTGEEKDQIVLDVRAISFTTITFEPKVHEEPPFKDVMRQSIADAYNVHVSRVVILDIIKGSVKVNYVILEEKRNRVSTGTRWEADEVTRKIVSYRMPNNASEAIKAFVEREKKASSWFWYCYLFYIINFPYQHKTP